MTLRLCLPASGWLGLDPVVSCRVIARACRLPNMIVAELYPGLRSGGEPS